MDSVPARRQLLAIGLQESELIHRRQHGSGPARGLWQVEPGKRSGLAGLFRLDSTREHAVSVCHSLSIEPHWRAVYDSLEHSDLLAAAFARLLLWSEPSPLPTDELGGWLCYLETWRPGKPRAAKWAENWAAATEAVNA